MDLTKEEWAVGIMLNLMNTRMDLPYDRFIGNDLIIPLIFSRWINIIIYNMNSVYRVPILMLGREGGEFSAISSSLIFTTSS